jgi:small-conductance mechanosensitive channel
MIDRKAFRISGLILFTMIAATVWRLSLLPDWRHQPVANPMLVLFALFSVPAAMLIMMIMPFFIGLTEAKDTLPSWQRWNSKRIVSWGVLFALLQVFVLTRSLGLVSLSRMDTARAMVMLIGVVFMMIGNATPKTPSLPHRGGFELDSWQKIRLLRFVGQLFVSVGLAFVLGGILLPLEWWKPVFLCLMLAAMAAAIWYGIQLRREQSSTDT